MFQEVQLLKILFAKSAKLLSQFRHSETDNIFQILPEKCLGAQCVQTVQTLSCLIRPETSKLYFLIII